MKLFPKFRVATPFCEIETTTTKNTIKQQITTNKKQKRVNYLFPITRRSREEKNGQILIPNSREKITCLIQKTKLLSKFNPQKWASSPQNRKMNVSPKIKCPMALTEVALLLSSLPWYFLTQTFVSFLEVNCSQEENIFCRQVNYLTAKNKRK